MVIALALALLAPVKEIRHDLLPRTLLLTFHDVIERRDKDALWFDCTTGELKGILDWLAGHGAHFVSLDQVYRHLTDGAALPVHPVAITFADNYEGFYARAWPVLSARHIPSAMFVHTGFVGSPIGRPKMSWSQLRELDRSGLVTIGSQTVTHRSVTTLSTQAIEKELSDSKRALEAHLGHRINYLAYPNGAFDANATHLAGETGYLMAFTERLTPAERSPGIFEVARYVHTKYRRGWNDANR